MRDPRGIEMRTRTEQGRAMAQLDSFFCAMTYLSTVGPHGASYDWHFPHGVMGDVCYCLQYADMA